MNRLFMLSVGCVLLGACSSSKELLPNSGPTSAEVMLGSSPQVTQQITSTDNSYLPVEIATNYDVKSQFSSEHIQELKRDFKYVYNPEIVGYVYPHFNQEEMPIPGYFTVFKLYTKNHYALTNEGVNE